MSYSLQPSIKTKSVHASDLGLPFKSAVELLLLLLLNFCMAYIFISEKFIALCILCDISNFFFLNGVLGTCFPHSVLHFQWLSIWKYKSSSLDSFSSCAELMNVSKISDLL